MKRCMLVAAALAVVVVGCGAVGAGQSEEKPAKQDPETVVKQVAEGNNAFALDLYGKLRGGEGNLFFSPYSISTALAMTYAGARGETEKQMAHALRLPVQQAKLHRAFGKLIDRLQAEKEKKGYQLVVANALWGQEGYEFLDDFLRITRENYGAGLRQLDFRTRTEAARRTINQWVEKQTRDKIKELIKKGVLDPFTRLVLTNAIYFKGDWASQFDEKRTRDEAFKLLDGNEVTVPMMHQAEDFGYAETEALQLLEMPYVGEELSMVVLLPEETDGLPALERSLRLKKLQGWLAKAHKAEVAVSMPKFELTGEFSLGDVLAKMGMPDAFSPGRADFSGMTGAKDLYISAVVHKAYVEVNEEGTEAAAATGVVMRLTAVPAEPRVFRADHPFIFLIRDRRTGGILFIGRVMNPSA